MHVIEGIEFIELIPEDRYEDIIIHLRKNFFADEPLNSSVQLCNRGEQQTDLEARCYKTLQYNYSVIACDKNTGEIAGVVLNGIVHQGDYDKELEKLSLVTNEQFKTIYSFLFNMNKKIDLFNKYNTDDIFEIRILSVDSKFRRKGIAFELLKRATDVAKRNGFKLAKSNATSYFTQRVLSQSNFKTELEVFYKNYKSENGQEVFNTNEPHTSLKIVTKYLED